MCIRDREVTLDLPNISLVNMDDETWGYQAIECLVKLNHRRLLYLSLIHILGVPAKR